MIQVMQKAAHVLQHVGSEPGIDLKDLSARTGLKKPGLLALLRTLTELGWLARNDRGGYALGDGLKKLARASLADDALSRTAAVYAQILAERIGEQVSIARLLNRQRVILARASVSRSVVVNTHQETHASLYRTATGLLLLSYLGETEFDEMVRLNGAPDAVPGGTTLEQLRKQCREIAKSGWAGIPSGDGQARYLAVPVFDETRAVVAAIGVSVPVVRLEGGREAGLLEEMRRAAAQMTAGVSLHTTE